MTDSGFSWSTGDNMVLGGVFWSDMTKDSPIDELLAKVRAGEVVTLEQFLDEQTILQEVTAPNTELLSYLVEHLEDMIDYVTLGRKRRADDESVQHVHTNEHYAYLSCEILSVNSATLTNALLKNERNMERLFQILYEPAPLPPRPTGYFHMILLMLAQKDPGAILTFASREPSSYSIAAALRSDALSAEATANDAVSGNGSTSASSSKAHTERGAKRPLDEESSDARMEMDQKKRAPPPGAMSATMVEDAPSMGAPDNVVAARPTLSAAPAPPMQNLGLLPLFLQHIDSYSMACSVLVLVQAAANQLETQASSESSAISKLIYSAQELSLSKAESAELTRARKLWTGGFGAANAIFGALKRSTDPYSHSNAAELLIELYKRAASARRIYFESKQLAAIHVTDDEQHAPFAMSEDELAEFSAAPAASGPSSSAADDGWTLSLIDDLCDMILSAPDFSSATDAAARVVSMLVVAYSQPFSSGEGASTTKQESCPEIERVLRRLAELVRRLNPEAGEKDFVATQWNSRIARLGMGRLLIVEIISNLIVCGYKSVAQELSYMDPDPVAALIDVFFKFEWNNVLHTLVEKTLKAILQGHTNTARAFATLPSKDAQEQTAHNQKAEKERQSTVEALLPLQKSIFPRLIERILDAYEGNSTAAVVEERYVAAASPAEGAPAPVKAQQPLRGTKGYMGHLRNIANACAEVVEAQNEKGGPAFDALGEDLALKQRWYDFANGKLAENNQMLSKPLGGAPIKREPIMNTAALLASFGSGPLSAEALLKVAMSQAGLDFGADDEDEDDDEEEDPEETMARYYKRKELLDAEKLAAANREGNSPDKAPQMVASSPQDSSWVVDDFAADFSETSGMDPFGSPSRAFDNAIFNPLAGLEASHSKAANGGGSRGGGASAAAAEDSEFDDFDPFGTSKPTHATSASVPIAQKKAPAPPPADDFGGVTPPGFEVIEKM